MGHYQSPEDELAELKYDIFRREQQAQQQAERTQLERIAAGNDDNAVLARALLLRKVC